jgi:uncharacterized phage protein (TIGR01671 family)
MREILFRGKREDNGAWETGSLIIKRMYTRENIVQIGDKMTAYPTPVIPETVGEYTGLADRNGRKIFEGDIIKHFYNPSGDEYDIGIVKWDSEDCMFFRTSKEFDDDKILGNYCEYEIIGNIHDNPELMQEVEE